MSARGKREPGGSASARVRVVASASGTKVEKDQLGIGPRLRRFIELRGMTIRDFAALAQIPERTLYNYLGGDRRPVVEHLANLAAVGVDLNWLLTGEIRTSFDLQGAPSAETAAAEALSADLELRQSLRERAIDAADYAQRVEVEAGRPPLGVAKLLTLAGKIFFVLVQTSVRMSTAIAELRRHGVSNEQIADIVASGARQLAEEWAAKVEPAPTAQLDEALRPLYRAAHTPPGALETGSK